jgi:hypothetical protein
MTPSACGTIRPCAGSSVAKPSWAVRLRRARLAALRRTGLLQTRTFLLLPTCPANGSTLCMATNRPAAFQFGDLECCALRPGNVHSADGWKEVLDPVVQCYRGKVTRIYFRADAAFAMPEVYELRLQLHALAYNLANFLRTLATPEPMSDWSLTTLKEKLIKIGAKVVSHGRYSCSRWPRSQSHGR